MTGSYRTAAKEAEMPFAGTADEQRTSFAARGEGPPDLLLMHGWAGSGAYFDETLAHLDTTRVRAITVDFAGHGNADESHDEPTLDRLAAETIAIADAAVAEVFVLLGFSMSAKFAQYVASQHPGRVAGLILVAGCPASEIPLPEEMIADWLRRAGDPRAMMELVEPFTSRPVAPHALERFGRDAARVPHAALEGTLLTCLTTAFVERLASVTMPTLVVGGLNDPIFGPDALRDGVVAALPQARLALLDCGHEIPLEAPGELAAVIEAFLAGTALLHSRPTATRIASASPARPAAER
jgi:pimeloyl-ACP methyl ester carboxylesterase